jgi:hypothetical protein
MTTEQGDTLIAAVTALHATVVEVQTVQAALLLGVRWSFVLLCCCLFFLIVQALKR